VVELTVEKASGERAFVDPNSADGPQKRAKLRLILDGYSGGWDGQAAGWAGGWDDARACCVSTRWWLPGSPAEWCWQGERKHPRSAHARLLRRLTPILPCGFFGGPSLPAAPITAGTLLANFQAGLYNNVPLSVSGISVLAGTQPEDAVAPADDASLDSGTKGSTRGGPAVLPLEILPAGDFEPVYRSPLDVRNGELPVLPLSIYGAGGFGWMEWCCGAWCRAVVLVVAVAG